MVSSHFAAALPTSASTDAETLELDNFVLVGLFASFFGMNTGRPAVGKHCAETLGFLPIILEHARRYRPIDFVLRENLIPGAIMVGIKDVLVSAEAAGLELTSIKIESGLVDLQIATLVRLLLE